MSYKLGKYNFINIPRHLNYNDYEDSLQAVVQSIKDDNNVKSIYCLGAEWEPGISDMDIVVVYKDIVNFKPSPSPWSLDDRTRFIFTHRYFSYTYDVFLDYYYIFPEETSNLKLVWGDEIILSAPDDGTRLEVVISFLFDIFINKILLIPYLVRENIDISVRRVMGELYSLKYTFYLLDKYCNIKDDRYDNFIKFITHLRENWFNFDLSDNLNELVRLHQDAIGIIFDSFIKFSDFLNKYLYYNYNVEGIEDFLFVTKKVTVKPLTNINNDLFLNFLYNKSIRFYFHRYKVENYYLVIPNSLNLLFYWYSSADVDFSRIFRSYLIGGGNVSVKIPDGICKRIEIMDKLMKNSIYTHGHFKIPFDFGLIINQSIKNKVLLNLLKYMRRYVK